MRLSEDEVRRFSLSYIAFMTVAYNTMVAEDLLPEGKEFLEAKGETKITTRDWALNDPYFLDDFLRENPADLDAEALATVRGFRNAVQGEFFVLRERKTYTVFMSAEEPTLAYAVLAVHEPPQRQFKLSMPIFLRTVLWPFEGKIVYDGVAAAYSFHFGPGMRSGLNDAFRQAEAQYGLITSLPYEPITREDASERLLLSYTHSLGSIERYQEEIDDLLHQEPALVPLYHQQLGKAHARSLGAKLREAGARQAWFAVLDDIIIASAPSEEALREEVSRLLPPEKRDWVHVFRHRGK